MSKKPKKLTVLLFIITFCLIAVFGAKAYLGSSQGSSDDDAKAKMKGNVNAPLKVTEFIDFQCPACAQGAKYLKETMQRHPDLIRLQLKHFPLQMHRYGVLSAQYAECAAEQGKFWQMHDLLLARQSNWKRLDDPRPAFDQMAKETRINQKALEVCLQSGRADLIIQQNKEEGARRSIRSTPTYFVNDKMVVGKKFLESEINNHLQKNGE